MQRESKLGVFRKCKLNYVIYRACIYLATFVSQCVLTHREGEMDVEEGKMRYADNAYNYQDFLKGLYHMYLLYIINRLCLKT